MVYHVPQRSVHIGRNVALSSIVKPIAQPVDGLIALKALWIRRRCAVRPTPRRPYREGKTLYDPLPHMNESPACGGFTNMNIIILIIVIIVRAPADYLSSIFGTARKVMSILQRCLVKSVMALVSEMEVGQEKEPIKPRRLLPAPTTAIEMLWLYNEKSSQIRPPMPVLQRRTHALHTTSPLVKYTDQLGIYRVRIG